MTARRFCQVDVFTREPYLGNPVAVVLDADGLDADLMQRFAAWTNLSETTFVLPPDDSAADYRVRIFTGSEELPFAGHPTLGTCHAWLQAGGEPRRPDVVMQQCGVGLVAVRRLADGLAFAAPPLRRSGPVNSDDLARVARVLGIEPAAMVDSQWVDNGPGWVGVLLESADDVRAVRPVTVDPDLFIGVVGPTSPGSADAFEVRGFFPMNGVLVEDPVTGSLNASLAGWLIATGRVRAPFTARQGTVIGRAGRIELTQDADGTIWTGGGTVTCIDGHVDL